jgi:hypothetical protein
VDKIAKLSSVDYIALIYGAVWYRSLLDEPLAKAPGLQSLGSKAPQPKADLASLSLRRT